MQLAERLAAEGIDVLTDDLDRYGRDETMDLYEAPLLVARPRTTAEVSTVLRIANELEIPVTPRGGGTGKAGGAIPTKGSLVLSIEKMDAIKEIDKRDRFCVVEPGVILANLHEAVEAEGLRYAIDMSSAGSCLIGGNVACDAGGERAVKYGTTRAQVTGVEAVLMDGSVIRCGGKLSKNVAGFPLHHLLVGSEGMLGVITEITLRLHPLPPYCRTLLAAFDTLEAAADAALAVEGMGFDPSALELIERAGVQLAAEHANRTIPHVDAAALLLVEVEAFDDDDAMARIEGIGEALFEAGAAEVDLAKREEVWGVRHAVAEAIKALPGYSAVDTSVPRRALTELVHGAHEIASSLGMEVVCFGHAGDGNIHADFIRRDADDANWDENVATAVRRLLELTLSLGGSITAEHGVGLLRRDDMAMQYDDATLAAMRALKTAWDPKGLLNPDKVLPT